MKRKRKSSRRRVKHSTRRKHAYNRGRKHHRKTRRNKGGKYSSFVKKHKGLFKKMGFGAASRKISAMYRASKR